MNKDYAVVFAGGGTKGSYQVGVIKALKELKINITAVSGTSIGAINGALVVQGDEDKLENIYSNKYCCYINSYNRSNICNVCLFKHKFK